MIKIMLKTTYLSLKNQIEALEDHINFKDFEVNKLQNYKKYLVEGIKNRDVKVEELNLTILKLNRKIKELKSKEKFKNKENRK